MNKKRQVTIRAILSSPRIGFTHTWHCIHQALRGIPIDSYRGCWWERGIEGSLQKALDAKTDFVITADYDSIFAESHLQALIKCIVENDHIDVLSSWQMRRGSGHSLMWPVGYKQGKQFKVDINKPLRVHTAHFGLTIIRVSALRKIPHPWFMNIPNGAKCRTKKDGTRVIELPPKGCCWGVDEYNGPNPKVDADIYFWNLLEKHGKKAYVLPCVKIGHLEELVAAPDVTTGMSQHYYPDQYETSNPRPVKVNPRKGKDEKPK